MRLAIGIALATFLFLVTGGHFPFGLLLVVLGFFLLLRYRTTWQPVSTTYRPRARRLPLRSGGSPWVSSSRSTRSTDGLR